MKNVIIYSTPTCHFCHLAKDFFNENGVKYVEYDVLANLEKRQEMLEKSGQRGVPVIDIDNQIIVGFDQVKVSSLLGI
ncbi:MAG: glutaredoxin domain-containing protein [Candidatus Paceibacterota bacterium]|jgi:glutaredoxin-like YruB-family protein